MKLFALLLVALVTLAGGGVVMADVPGYQDADATTNTEVPVSQRTPAPVFNPSYGAGDVATNAFTVDRTTPTRFPTLPAGKTKFQVTAWGSDIIAGYQTDISTAAVTIGIRIPAGSSRVFDTATTTPTWWGLASGAANATGVIDAAW